MNLYKTYVVIVAAWLCVISGGQIDKAMGASPELHVLAFADDGAMTPRSSEAFERLLASATSPTHVFLMSHGWNNTYDAAVSSYNRILSQLDRVATLYNLRPTEYRPLVIGVYWPSKAGSENDVDRSASEDFRISDARDVLNPRLSPDTWSQDVASLNELLAAPRDSLTTSDFELAGKLFKRYRLTPADGNTEVDAEIFSFSSDRGADLSIRDVFGLLSYWNKKELAGLVGRRGVNSLLAKLQAKYSTSRYHLFGHSFGAKVVLATVTGDATINPVNSIVLLQPAISYRAFSAGGGYEAAVEKVSGPLVATYSELDAALDLPYRTASRIAGQTTERSVSKYSAMGSVGPFESATIRMVSESSRDMYTWEVGEPIGIESTDYITGHSEIYNGETARMIWSVINKAEPVEGQHRSITANQLKVNLDASLAYARTASRKDDSADFLSTFAAAVSKGISDSPIKAEDHDASPLFARNVGGDFSARRVGGELGGFSHHANPVDANVFAGFGPPSARPGFDTAGFAAHRLKTPFGNFAQSAVFQDARSRDNLKMIVEGGSMGLFNLMVPQIIDPENGTIANRTAPAVPQCVCVGYREKNGGDWKFIGSGCLFVTGDDRQGVMTAAHVKPTLISLDEVEFGVFIGDNFRARSRGEIVPVRLRVEHPEYDEDSKKNDVAVLLLSKPVKLANAVPFTVTDLSSLKDPDHKGLALFAAGFGSTDGTNNMAFDGKKRCALLPLAPTEYTQQQVDAWGIHNGLEFVVGKLGLGIDSCFGDSGGPVFFLLDDKPCLFGSISRGIKTRCGDGSVQVRLARYTDFITDAVSK